MDVQKTGIIKPESIRQSFSGVTDALAKLESFSTYKDWTVFDYLGRTDTMVKDLKHVMRQAGILPGSLKQYTRGPYIAVVGVSARNGVICVLLRSGNVKSQDLSQLSSRVAISLGVSASSFTQVGLTEENIVDLAQLYRKQDYRVTRVRHLTNRGDLTYGNPDGLEGDEELAAAEDAYGTMKAIRDGRWKGIRIYVNDASYELVLSKHRSRRSKVTLYPLRLKGWLPKSKVVRMCDHFVSNLIHVKPPVALKRQSKQLKIRETQ